MGRKHRAAGQPEQAWLTPEQSLGTLDALLAGHVLADSARLDPQAAASMLRQLGAATRSGVPASTALTMLARSAPDSDLGRLADELAHGVIRGASVGDLLQQHQATFGEAALVIIQAGEQMGELGEALERAANLLEENAHSTEMIRKALTHPLLAAAAVAALVCTLAFVATPLLATLAQDHALPGLTGALLTIAKYLPVAGGLALLLALGVRTSLRVEAAAAKVRARLDRLMLRLPGLSTLVLQRGEGQLATTTAWLLKGGATTAEALRVAAPTTGNTQLAQAAARCAAQVSEGKRLGEALADETVFSAMFVQVATASADTGALPAMLTQYGQQSTRESKRTADRLTSNIEPAATAAAGLVLAGWLAGVLIPVLQATAALT